MIRPDIVHFYSRFALSEERCIMSLGAEVFSKDIMLNRVMLADCYCPGSTWISGASLHCDVCVWVVGTAYGLATLVLITR